MRQRIARAGLRKQQRRRVWAARRDNNRIGLPSGAVATLTRLAKGSLSRHQSRKRPGANRAEKLLGLRQRMIRLTRKAGGPAIRHQANLY